MFSHRLCIASCMMALHVLRSSLLLASTSTISGFSIPAVIRKRPAGDKIQISVSHQLSYLYLIHWLIPVQPQHHIIRKFSMVRWVVWSNRSGCDVVLRRQNKIRKQTQHRQKERKTDWPRSSLATSLTIRFCKEMTVERWSWEKKGEPNQTHSS